MGKTNDAPEMNEFLMACANSGLFPLAGFSQEHVERLSFSSVLRDCFEKRPYLIRHPVVQDLPRLVELDAACWPELLRTGAGELRARVERFPSGHCVMEMEGSIVGAVYSQRIGEIDSLKTVTEGNVSSLHSDDGPLSQLLSINVLPRVQNLGLGDQLLEFMLQYCSAREGVQGIAAVSLCKEYGLRGATPLEEYILMRDEEGYLADPILRFHEAHGGRIRGLAPGYRPRDLANKGHGVLVEYDVLNRRPRGRRSGMPKEARPGGESPEGPLLPLVEKLVRRVMSEGGGPAFSASRPLMDMGFDSLKLMQLRSLLGGELGEEPDAAFFFRYPSPEKIARFFEAGESGERQNETRPERAPPIELAGEEKKAPRALQGEGGAPSQDEAVAIVGMACRFPGNVKNADDFWKLLRLGTDAVTEIPETRWDSDLYYDSDPEKPGKIISRHGGFITGIDRFDAPIFNVSPREAAAMDPQQRLLLEVAWEALESAAINPVSWTLNSFNVSKIVICCFTSHTMISRLPKDISEKIVSLVDLTARELMAGKEKSLLLASLGSYRRDVFRSTEDAVRAGEYIVEPDEEDKIFIHGLIYERLKLGKDVAPVYTAVRGLLDKYRLSSFIAGCTEFHILSRHVRAKAPARVSFVDPLFGIAQRLGDIL